MGKRHTKRARQVPPDERWPQRIALVGVLVAVAVVPLAFNPLGYSWFGPPKLATLSVAAFLIGLSAALQPSRFRRALESIRRSVALYPLVAVVAVVLVNLVVHGGFMTAFAGSFPEYQGVLLWLFAVIVGLGVLLMPRSGLSLVARGLVVSTAITSALAVLQRLGIGPFASITKAAQGRIGSTLGNASNLGVYLLLTVPLALWVARTDIAKGWRRAGWTALVFAGIALVLSMSRGAWLGALAGTVVWVVAEGLTLPKPARIRLFAVVTLTLIALLVVTLLIPAVSSRVISAFDTDKGSVKWRVGVWQTAVQLTARHPLQGIGINAFRFEYPAYRPEGLRTVKEMRRAVADPHNLELNWAASMGIPGALALLALTAAIAASLVRTLRSSRREDLLGHVAVLSALVAAIVALQFHFVTLDTLPLVVALSAVAIPEGGEVGLSSSATSKRILQAVTPILAAVTFVVAFIGLMLPLADQVTDAAMRRLAQPNSWAQARELFSQAQALAFWEPAYDRAEASAAGRMLGTGYDEQVAADGIAAISRVRAALPRDPGAALDEGRIRAMVGSQTGDRQQLVNALRAFTTGAQLDPYDARQWEGVGLCQIALGRLPEAKIAFERALKCDQRSVPALKGMAQVLEDTGRHAEAIVYEQRAVETSAK